VPRSVRRADLVLADSESTKRDLIELLDVPVERVRVVMAGVDAHFQPVTDMAELTRIREHYHLPERFILSVGTLQPRKNFTGLIEAFHQMRQRTQAPQQLVIVGQKGWLYEGIFAKVAELGLEEQVSFLGFVADDDLPALYTLADLFAFPSFYEGFGIPILEAMACGTPVVASDASSLPEVVGDAGVMVKPEDIAALSKALERALEDSILRAGLIARGQEQARRFTWEQSARQLYAAYQSVIVGR
jgi:glycosyltransferase involved in cell wall biosynthesis